MIGMIHGVPWYLRSPKPKDSGPSRKGLDQRCAHVFDGCVIENAIPFVDEPFDHLKNLKRYVYDSPN